MDALAAMSPIADKLRELAMRNHEISFTVCKFHINKELLLK